MDHSITDLVTAHVTFARCLLDDLAAATGRTADAILADYGLVLAHLESAEPS